MSIRMKVPAQLALITAAALSAAGVTWLVKGPPQRMLLCDPSQLKPDELCLSQIPADAPVLWVDARSRAEWLKNGLPGSLLWNLDPAEDMQAFEAELAPRAIDAPRVVVYCGDENCGVSRQVAERIRALGMGADVYILHGGWRALAAAGRVRNSSPAP